MNIKQLIKVFSLKKNTLKSISETIQQFQPALRTYEDFIEDCYIATEEYRLKLNLMTYDDILVHFLELLQDEHGDAIRRRFDYILVDEYQDTTKLQVEILYELSRDHQNIMAVGDDCQSIYSFRGALCTQMQDFINSFPNTYQITLEGNYRSTEEVLDFSNNLIKDSTAVFPKELNSALEKKGQSPELISSPNQFELSYKIIDAIQQELLNGQSLSDIAILYRSSRQTRFIETELQRIGMAYRKDGSLKFNESAHMKDFFSLLNFFLNPSNEPAALRILQLLNGIGPKSALKLSKQLRNKEKLSPPKASLDDFNSLKTSLKESVLLNSPQEQAQNLLAWYSGFGKLKYDNFIERIPDLDFIIKRLEDYDSIEAMIEDLHLNSDEEQEDDVEQLTLSTVHSSKGKEWETVFILDSGDKSFPLRETSHDIIEEERRLLYVAVTRAKQHLKLFYPLSIEQGEKSFQSQKPSQFIPNLNTAQDKKSELNFFKNETEDFFEESSVKNNDDDFEDLIYNYEDSW